MSSTTRRPANYLIAARLDLLRYAVKELQRTRAGGSNVSLCSGITSCFLERMFVCVPLAPRPVARVSQRLRFQRHSERLSGWQPGRETSSGALRARMCACVCDFFFGFFFIWWVKLGAGSVWQQISVSALWTHKKKSKSNHSVEYKMRFFHHSDEKQRWFNICCSFSLSLLLNCS